jgi:IS5 family transposase
MSGIDSGRPEKTAGMRPESMAAMHRIQWPPCTGFSGRHGPDYALGFTHGARLRVDTSVTETNIHYPTDSSLLDDAARVLSRWLVQAQHLVRPKTATAKAQFRDRHRQAHHLAVQIARLARKGAKQGENTARRQYRQLVRVVETLLQQAAYAQDCLRDDARLKAQAVIEVLAYYVPLVERVVAQTTRRVFEGQTVPAAEKLVSLFEPDTAIIRRGKAKPHDTEFGCKVWFSEVEGGLISEYVLQHGNPSDTERVIPSVKQHRKLFGRAPHTLSADRGMHSVKNEQRARQLGVKQVSLPQPGHKTSRRQRQEQQDWYRAAQRFRNGIEGRISQVRRARGLTRCLNHGWSGLERWIGWGVIANNISVLVVKCVKRRRNLSKALAAQ